MKDRIKKWTAVCITVAMMIFALSSAVISFAIDDEAYDGYAADDLTIRVGYMGGPYYVKKVFTLEEIEAMDVVTNDYTFIDNMPSVIIDHAKGVRLSDLMDAAGIDMGSIQVFQFYTVDKQGDESFTDFTKTELIDTPRYCYYSLPDNFDEEAGVGNADSTSIAEPVETIMSFADDWNRVIKGAEFGSDYENLNTATRFRLIFGQVDASTRTANRSAKWVREIKVQLGGSPTLTTSDPSTLDLKLGSQKTLSVSIRNADDAIQSDSAQIQWHSDNEDAVTVDQDGTITVVGEGTARITATLGDSSVSFTVNGSKEEEDTGNEDPEAGPGPDDSPDDPDQNPADPPDSQDENPEETQDEEPQDESVEEQQKEVKIYSGVGSGSGSSTGSGQGNGAGSLIPGAGGSAAGSSSAEKEKTKKEEKAEGAEKKTMGGVTLESSEGGETASSTETLPDSLLEASGTADGGVQNWRVFEMSEDAVELPDIQLDNPLLGFTKVMLALVFLGGVAAKLIWFYLRAGKKSRKTVNLPARV